VRAAQQQGRIQSLVRAFSILETIASHPGGIALRDLSKLVSLHTSTAHHLVKTMVTMGYVSQAADSRHFSIGGRFFHLAASALNETRLLNMVNPYVRKLARETRSTCQFAVRSGDRAAVLVKGEGGDIFHSAEQVGASRPTHCTSHGKVMLSGLSDVELDEFLRTYELERMTSNTITSREQLRREIELTRKRGIAYDDAEFHPELRCVAAPVRDFTGRVIGSIGVSGPIWRLSLQLLQAKAEAVRKAANQLSRDLGYEPGKPALRGNGVGGDAKTKRRAALKSAPTRNGNGSMSRRPAARQVATARSL
jgi:DNA-binding IclR family transcriptional regulator